jgi:BolA protein
MKEQIKQKLLILSPKILNVIDFSAMHKGHAGWKESGETHFEVQIVSDKFKNLTKVQRHKLIHQILSSELKNQIHALVIKGWSEEEYENYLRINSKK